MNIVLFVLALITVAIVLQVVAEYLKRKGFGPAIVGVLIVGILLFVLWDFGTTAYSSSCRFNGWNALRGAWGIIMVCLLGFWAAIIKNWVQGRNVEAYATFFGGLTLFMILINTVLPDQFDPDDPDDKERAFKEVRDSPFGDMFISLMRIS